MDDAAYARARRDMVEMQIRGRGVRDERILAAMAAVPRHLFVAPELRFRAYHDGPLPIGEGQTISQPFMVALTCQRAQVGPDARVLEVGCGSGYQAAVLAHLGEEVWAIERIPELAERARKNLESAGVDNVHVLVGDGTLGHPAAAPYDAIVVAAGAPRVPPALVEQLGEGGHLVIPVGSRHMQSLRILTKRHGKTTEVGSEACVFVPLVGKDGWQDDW
jgi:protein-L-isoaspartate(D-aspartate) O-methyltransferase